MRTISAGIWGWGLVMLAGMIFVGLVTDRVVTAVVAVLITFPLGWIVQLVRSMASRVLGK